MIGQNDNQEAKIKQMEASIANQYFEQKIEENQINDLTA